MAEQTVPVTLEELPLPASREGIRESERYLAPPVDIYETGDGLVVVADLPGVQRDALDVRVDDSILTIQGRSRHIALGEPVWTEYQLLDFYRQFELPEEVDQDKISAELKHGVLTIALPEAEHAQTRQIQVDVS